METSPCQQAVLFVVLKITARCMLRAQWCYKTLDESNMDLLV